MIGAVLVFVVALSSVSAANTGASCSDPINVPVLPFPGHDGITCNNPVSAYSCDLVTTTSSRGFWYFVYLSETTLLEASLCSDSTQYDTAMFLFSSCRQNMSSGCTAYNDDYCDKKSRIEWTAQANIGYWLFVTGYASSCGYFQLQISQVQPPDNTDCNNAIDIGEAVPYNTVGSTLAATMSTAACNNRQAAGLWYKVTWIYDAASLVASTCSSETDYDTMIEIYDSGCPGSCNTYNDDSCSSQSRVVWQVTEGQTYHIFVTGYSNARGHFNLIVDTVPTVAHATCAQAMTVTLPFVYRGSTALIPKSWSNCNQKDFQGLWFRLSGNNKNIVATTCNSVNNYEWNTLIDVYRSCDTNAGCVTTNDDYCGVHSLVTFNTLVGYEYYIFVASWSESGGNFTITIQESSTANNDQCYFGQDTEVPAAYSSSTAGTGVTTGGSCRGAPLNRNGKWYQIVNSGSEALMVNATTCNQDTTIATNIEVYKTCSLTDCVGISISDANTCSGKAQIAFSIPAGETYMLFVYGANGATGWYHIELLTSEGSIHSDCAKAYSITSLPFSYMGETISSKHDYDDCLSQNKQGMWFTFSGTGNKVLAHTCDFASDFDTVIEAYDQCQGTTQACVAMNDDYNDGFVNCGTLSRINFQTNLNAQYWIYVTGFGSNTGVFMLDVVDEAVPSNWHCQTATFVPVQTSTLFSGYTGFATFSAGTCQSGSRKGLWYVINGYKEIITVDTCSAHTDFDTQIEVYYGCSSDGGLRCANMTDTQACTPKSTVTWEAGDYTEYYVFVTGIEDGSGFVDVQFTRTPRTVTSSSASKHSGGGGGLSGGAIFGIVLAVLVCVFGIPAAAIGAYWYYRKRQGYTLLG